MSETVAVALISALPTATVALAALAGNFLLEGRRRGHERGQLARQFDHDRQMRVLEWRRADRLQRLQPIQDYLGSAGREVTRLDMAVRGLREARGEGKGADAVAEWEKRLHESLLRVIAIQGETPQIVLRSPDERLAQLLFDLAECFGDIGAAYREDGEGRSGAGKDVRMKMVKTVKQAWDRLEELQSAL